jgi:undecaprenyl-diphosphatase
MLPKRWHNWSQFLRQSPAAARWLVGILLAAWLFLAAVLADLIEDIINLESVVARDNYWQNFFYQRRTPGGVQFFSVITQLGNWPVIVIVSVIIVAVSWRYRRWRSFIGPFILTLFSGEAVTFIGKILIHRYRPLNGVMVLSDFSFPSGHSTIAVAFYGFLAYFIFRQTKSAWCRGLIVGAALLLIFLIGYSRLYLGVHFLSDIIGGYLVGLLALLAGIFWHEWLLAEKKRS